MGATFVVGSLTIVDTLVVYPTALKAESELRARARKHGCQLGHRVTTFPELTDALARDLGTPARVLDPELSAVVLARRPREAERFVDTHVDSAATERDVAEIRRLTDELEWVRSNAKARQTKSKARLERYEEMAANLLEAYRTGTPEAMQRHWNDTWHGRVATVERRPSGSDARRVGDSPGARASCPNRPRNGLESVRIVNPGRRTPPEVRSAMGDLRAWFRAGRMRPMEVFQHILRHFRGRIQT